MRGAEVQNYNDDFKLSMIFFWLMQGRRVGATGQSNLYAKEDFFWIV